MVVILIILYLVLSVRCKADAALKTNISFKLKCQCGGKGVQFIILCGLRRRVVGISYINHWGQTRHDRPPSFLLSFFIFISQHFYSRNQEKRCSYLRKSVCGVHECMTIGETGTEIQV